MLFSGKTAVVTGAGSGIGQAVAEMLAKEGARVALADLFEEKAENTRRIIARCRPLHADVPTACPYIYK